MRSRRRALALLGAFFMLSLVLAACGGGGIPGNAVVKIGDDTIKTGEFNHWMQVAAGSAQAQTGQTGKPQVPVPPKYTACIAGLKATAATPAKGQPVPSDATYRTQCQQEYAALRETVLQFLISSAWYEGEAYDNGVTVSDAAVKKDLEAQIKQSFPQRKNYLAYLKSSGYAHEDLLYRTRVQDLTTKLREKLLKGTDKVSDAQIAAYYNKNRDKFAVPEKRDLQVVLTKTKAKAQEAKQAIQSGQSFKSVATKYSIDPSTRTTGGVVAGVPQGQQVKELDAAVFKAPKNTLTGPVKTQFGYYVFNVTKVTPGSQQSLAQSKASIKQTLITQRQQKVLTDFVKKYEAKWKKRTECRKGYTTSLCNNAPKATATSTVAPGTATQNAAPADGSAGQ